MKWRQWFKPKPEPTPAPHVKITQCLMIGCKGPWIEKPRRD